MRPLNIELSIKQEQTSDLRFMILSIANRLGDWQQGLAIYTREPETDTSKQSYK